MEISLKSVKSDDFSNTWNIKIFNLTSKFGFWIFHNDAHSCVELRAVERFWNAYLQRTWSLLFRHFFKSPTEMHRTVFFNQ